MARTSYRSSGVGSRGEAVFEQSGGAVDACSEHGQSTARISGFHDVRKLGRFGEFDREDLAVGQADRGDLLGAPGTAVVHEQDFAGETGFAGVPGGVGGNPVDGEATGVPGCDTEFFEGLARAAAREGDSWASTAPPL
ncbi:hypothetical protein [Streptomyces sp. NPDC056323]|uniref:hypothetical protein n=1 Tax=Streptomyces sp. NPDC056323 TaxID=3345784 RepID=UPI0035E2FAFC